VRYGPVDDAIVHAPLDDLLIMITGVMWRRPYRVLQNVGPVDDAIVHAPLMST